MGWRQCIDPKGVRNQKLENAFIVLAQHEQAAVAAVAATVAIMTTTVQTTETRSRINPIFSFMFHQVFSSHQCYFYHFTSLLDGNNFLDRNIRIARAASNFFNRFDFVKIVNLDCLQIIKLLTGLILLRRKLIIFWIVCHELI